MAEKKTVVTQEKKVVRTRTYVNGLFDKNNLTLMGIGLLLIALGMILMAGGKSEDPSVFNPDEVYSTTRITIAPILIVLGLVVEVIAIFRKPKTEEI